MAQFQLFVTAVVVLIFSLGCFAAKDVMQMLAPNKLNVHLVPHSHDDPGWLKTADQYYSGSNSSIYRASVEYIFYSVIDELTKNEDRKFTFCEISFFSRWWHEQDDNMKQRVKNFLANGQLGFVNGGWVMHDEASAHYVSMIDQTTLGHRFLLEELNYRPRVGWQIDPFGHSNTHSWLSSEVGFDALFFGRIDYQDRAKRKNERALEFIWKGSKSQSDAEVFTGAFSDGNYAPPEGFCIDTNCPYCKDDPVVSDPLLETYNLDEKIQLFINGILAEQAISRGNNIMLRMGADFVYQNAQAWYRSMDTLIKEINKRDKRFNLFYSDPTSYMRARAAEKDVVWPSKTDDFFPYSDSAHAFWAGYFTSRPTLKYLERISSSYLQVLKQIAALPSGPSIHGVDKAINKLTAAVGLINHHDAVTGTSKQHVADDYKKILSAALAQAEEVLSYAVGKTYQAENMKELVNSNNPLPTFTVCRNVNESVCDATQALKAGDSSILLVYNPLPRTSSQQISVYLSDVLSDKKLAVTVMALSNHSTGSVGGKFVASELIQNIADSPNANKAPYTLLFSANNIPALSFAAYRVHIVDEQTAQASSTPISRRLEAKEVEQLAAASSSDSSSMKVEFTGHELKISNGLVSVTFNRKSGLMSSMTRGENTISISNDIRYYRSFGPHIPGYKQVIDNRDPHLKNTVPNPELADVFSYQPSGAYIFRTEDPNEVPKQVCDIHKIDVKNDCFVNLKVVHGRQIVEVHQQFADWVSQVVRLRADSEVVEFENTVGPIPTKDFIGKEVITKFDTSLNTGGNGQNLFYTDSNGREFMERKFNYRPTWELEVFEPIAGNYYPVSTAIYIKDTDAKLQLSLCPDRSLAAASLANGELELMLHRRLVVDDLRGVDEPLDETDGGIEPYPSWKRIGDGIVVTGRQYLLLSPLDDGMKELRTLMDKIYLPFAKFYSTPQINSIASLSAAKSLAKSALAAELPINVHLVTLEKVADKRLLVRLGHQFAVEEDPVYAQPVSVDLGAVLANYKPVSLSELTLSANQDKAEQQSQKISWQYELGRKVQTSDLKARLGGIDGLVVTLTPMQIRTFYVDLA